MDQFCFAMEASKLERENECESVMRAVPVGEVAGGAGEAAEELLELAESRVAAEVGGWVAARAAAGELCLVAVEHSALVPTRHGCGGGGGGEIGGGMRVRGCGLGGRRGDGNTGMDGGGKRVIEEGLGGKMVEVLAGGGLCSLPVR